MSLVYFSVLLLSAVAYSLPVSRKVDFFLTDYRGERYIRPLGSSQPTEPSVAVDCYAQQVHISLGSDALSMCVTFVSLNRSDNSIIYSETLEGLTNNFVKVEAVSSESYSQLINIVSNLYNPAMGAPLGTTETVVSLQNSSSWAYSIVNGTFEKWYNYHYQGSTPSVGLGQYNNPYMTYSSPIIHTAVLTDLVPGKTYFYKPLSSCEDFSFTMPEISTGTSDSYPYKVGLVCDLGQTAVSNASINALIAIDPSVVLLSGDLSYADGYYELWDAWGNLMEPLNSKIPVITTGGNHEFGSSEAWLSYSKRYPTPYRASGSTNFCYYGKEVGVIHVIALCSYAGFTEGSLQYDWLSSYLSTQIDRTITPWLIVMMHVPFYSSNSGHWMEGELMRRAIEPLLYQYGVDFVLVGHVHAYERTYNVYNNTVDPCGPIHLTIGDGGNYEGAYVPWLDPMPSWSAFREASFGVGELEFFSSTQASYSWHRHACDSESDLNYHMNFSDACVTYEDNSAMAMLTSDIFNVTKPSETLCPNRYISTKTTTDVTITNDDFNDDNTNTVTYSQATVIGLSVAVGILSISTVALSIFSIKLYYIVQ